MINIGELEFEKFHLLVIKEFEMQLQYRNYCLYHNKELITETYLTAKKPITYILKFKILNN